MWILGSLSRETGVFVLPGLLAVAIAIAFPELGEVSLVYGLLATALIDSGHVYTTAWRTWLHAGERRHYRYWALPLFFCALFSAWYFAQLPYLWSFVVYATLYHHVRQVYGFSKWYQALNGRQDRTSDAFLYAFALGPMFIYHFRTGVTGGYYSEQDLFLWPMPVLHKIFLAAYFASVGAWVIREINLWRSGVREANRLISVAYPALIYGYCFLVGVTITQVLFPLLIIHGVAYGAVMQQTLNRTQAQRFARPGMALAAVILTALTFGLLESWLEEELVHVIREYPLWLSSLFIGLSLTPLFCHYAFDAVIWRSRHREAKLVYGVRRSPGP